MRTIGIVYRDDRMNLPFSSFFNIFMFRLRIQSISLRECYGRFSHEVEISLILCDESVRLCGLVYSSAISLLAGPAIYDLFTLSSGSDI